MQRTSPILIALALALILLAAFGVQAQAQDGSSAPGTLPPGTIPPGKALVNVAHFAPFATDPVSTSVTVSINGLDTLTEVVYSDIARGLLLDAGTYTVEIKPTGSPSVAMSGVFTLADGVSYSLLAVGDGSLGAPLELEPILNTVAPPAPGKAKMLVGHYAPFNANPALTAVDLCNDATKTAIAGPIIYGINSGYQEFDAGIYDLSIALAGTNCTQTAYDLPPLQFNPGAQYDAFAIGKNSEAYPLAVVSISGLDFPAMATVGHFAPFGNTIAETAVDVRVNGQVALTDVVYGEYFPDLVVPSGPVLVEVLAPAGDVSATVAMSAVVVLNQMSKYDLFAIGGANGWPLGFAAAEISKTAPSGLGLLTLGHLAPFAPLAAQTTVDVCRENNTVLAPNVSYPTLAANLELPPDTYDLKIARAGTGCQTLVLDVAPFQLKAGDIRDALVIGAPLELFVPPTVQAGPAAGPDFPLQVTSTTGLRPPFDIYMPVIEYNTAQAE